MRFRLSALLSFGLLLVACGGDAEEAAVETETTQAVSMSADAAALEAKVTELEAHYNMHHASMVADFYADSAFRLMANGVIDETACPGPGAGPGPATERRNAEEARASAIRDRASALVDLQDAWSDWAIECTDLFQPDSSALGRLLDYEEALSRQLTKLAGST